MFPRPPHGLFLSDKAIFCGLPVHLPGGAAAPGAGLGAAGRAPLTPARVVLERRAYHLRLARAPAGCPCRAWGEALSPHAGAGFYVPSFMVTAVDSCAMSA